MSSGVDVKVKVKVHTLDIAPLRSESPSTAEALRYGTCSQGFHSFTCTPTRSSAIRMSHIPASAFPAAANTHLPTPEGWELNRTWCEVAQAEIRTRNLPIANQALSRPQSTVNNNKRQKLKVYKDE